MTDETARQRFISVWDGKSSLSRPYSRGRAEKTGELSLGRQVSCARGDSGRMVHASGGGRMGRAVLHRAELGADRRVAMSEQGPWPSEPLDLKERQLREYNKVLARSSARREKNAQVLLNWWCAQTGVTSIPKNQFTWLKNELNRTPKESVRSAMEIAIGRGMIRDWRYVIVVLRNWREDGNGGASLA